MSSSNTESISLMPRKDRYETKMGLVSCKTISPTTKQITVTEITHQKYCHIHLLNKNFCDPLVIFIIYLDNHFKKMWANICCI